MSDHLNDEFFKRLSGKMPDFKKKVAEVQTRNMAKNGNKQEPCVICGALHNSWNGFAEKKKHCEKCAKLLKEGYTALISVDNRFAFVRFPAATEEQRKAIAGAVMTVTAEQMDKAQGKPAEKPPENPANN